MNDQEPDSKPDWVFFGERPALTYAEKLALYQRDQELRLICRSRAEYEAKRAELFGDAEGKKKGP